MLHDTNFQIAWEKLCESEEMMKQADGNVADDESGVSQMSQWGLQLAMIGLY